MSEDIMEQIVDTEPKEGPVDGEEMEEGEEEEELPPPPPPIELVKEALQSIIEAEYSEEAVEAAKVVFEESAEGMDDLKAELQEEFQCTLLGSYIRDKNIKMVVTLVKAGVAELDPEIPEENSLLAMCIADGDREMAEELISVGVFPDPEGHEDLSPVVAAVNYSCSSGDISMLRFILDQGCHPDSRARDAKYTADRPVVLAAKNNNAEALAMLVDGAADVNMPDHSGDTALDIAMSNLAYDTMEYLLEKGGDPRFASNSKIRTYTAFFGAVENMRYRIVELMCEAGADTNFDREPQKRALFASLKPKGPEMVRILCEHGADTNFAEETPEGPALTRVVAMASIKELTDDCAAEIIGYLCSHGANPNATILDGLHTSLIVAAENGLPKVAKALLAANAETEINAGKKCGAAFVHAALSIHLDIMQLLFDSGADVNASLGEVHKNPITLLAEMGCAEGVDLLIAMGANLEYSDASVTGTAMCRAASNGHWEIIELLVSKGGANMEATDGENFTPLEIAVRENKVQAATILVELGANTEVSDSTERGTPLIQAVKYQFADMVECLLFDPTKPDTQRGQRANVNGNDDDNKTAVVWSVIKDDVNILRILLKAGAYLEATFGLLDCTALIYAAELSREACCHVLMDAGADMHAIQIDGVSPLVNAAANGLESVVQVLLDEKVDKEASDETGLGTPLIRATANHHHGVVDLLFEKEADEVISDVINLESTNKYGETALVIAAQRGNIEMVKRLLAFGVDLEVSHSKNDGTALMRAVIDANLEMAQLLLESGASANGEDEYGRTGLVIACQAGNEEIVTLLLAQNPNLENCKNGKPGTAIFCAAGIGAASIVKALADAGADVNARDANQLTPLIASMETGFGNCVTELLAAGAETDVMGDSGDGTALLRAVKKQYDASAREILEAGANVNLGDGDKQTPLCLAAAQANESLVMLLLEFGADTNAKTIAEGMSPLLYASFSGSFNVVSMLLDAGADVHHSNKEGENSLILAVDNLKRGISEEPADAAENEENADEQPNGYRVVINELLDAGNKLEVMSGVGNGTALVRAASQGLDDVVAVLIERGASVASRDSQGVSSLVAAVRGNHDSTSVFLLDHELPSGELDTAVAYGSALGNVKMVSLLLDAGGSPNGALSDDKPALICAVEGNHELVVDLLLGAGADINACDMIGGGPALLYAARYGSERLVKALIAAGADVDGRSGVGKTALMVAAENSRKNTVHVLLNHGANINSIFYDVEGRAAGSILMSIGMAGTIDVMELLLDRGADTEVRDYRGNTLLCLLAPLPCPIEVLDLLVSKGANLNASGANNFTPLMFAVKAGNLDNINFFLNKGAHVECRSSSGDTPLMLAAYLGSRLMVSVLLENDASILALNDNGFTAHDLAERNSFPGVATLLWSVPLLRAAKFKRRDLVQGLVEAGVPVNVTDTSLRTPLMLAASSGCVDTVQVLIEMGATVDLKDDAKRTALFYAASTGYSEIVRLLIAKNALVDNLDANNDTPLHLAVRNNHRSCASELVKAGANVNLVGSTGLNTITEASQAGRVAILDILIQSDGIDVNNGIRVTNLDSNSSAVKALYFPEGGHFEHDCEEVFWHGNSTDEDEAEEEEGVDAPTNATSRAVSEGPRGKELSGAATPKATLRPETPGIHSAISVLLGDVNQIEGLDETPSSPVRKTMSANSLGVYDSVSTAIIGHRSRRAGPPPDKEGYFAIGAVPQNGDERQPKTISRESGFDAVNSTSLFYELSSRGLGVPDGPAPSAPDEPAPSEVKDHNNESVELLDLEDAPDDSVILEDVIEVDEELSDGHQFAQMDHVLPADVFDSLPITHAVKSGHTRAVRTLLNSSAIGSIQNEHGESLMALAFRIQKYDVVRVLASHGISVNVVDPKSQKTGLMFAISSNSLDFVTFVLENGADVNATDADGRTALMFAASNGQRDIIAILLEFGAVVTIADSFECTAMKYASDRGWIDCMALIYDVEHASMREMGVGKRIPRSKHFWNKVKNQKKFYRTHVDVIKNKRMRRRNSGQMINENENSAVRGEFTTAIILGDVERLHALLEEYDGFNINGLDDVLRPFLMTAIEFNHEAVVRILIEHGAEIDARDEFGSTPLHIACNYGFEQIVRVLLAAGASTAPANAEHLRASDLALERFPSIAEIVHGRQLAKPIQEENLASINRMLEIGANINAVGYDGRNALMNAVHFEKLDLLPYLIERGADVDHQNPQGRTALHNAVLDGQEGMASTLLEMGASTEKGDSEGRTPVQLAYIHKQDAIMELLIDMGADINHQDSYGVSLAMMMCSEGDVARLGEMLNNLEESTEGENANADQECDEDAESQSKENEENAANEDDEVAEPAIQLDVNLIANDGETCLMRAAESGSAQLCKRLIALGNDPTATTVDGNQAIHYAARSMSSEATKCLIEAGASPSIKGKDSCTPLIIATLSSSFENVKVLLAHGAPIDDMDSQGCSALWIAAGTGNLDIALALLNNGASVSTQDVNHVQPLVQAARKGHIGVVVELLNRGADILSETFTGENALMESCANGHVEVAAYFVDKGIDYNKVNKDGNAAFHFAAVAGHTNCVQMLVDRGIDMEVKGTQGCSALSMAAASGKSDETLEFLLDEGAYVESRNADGKTPLVFACRNGHFSIAEMLILRGADAFATDNLGSNALLEACIGNHTKIVEMVLDAGVNINCQNQDGYTPLMVASSQGHLELVKILLSKGAATEFVNKNGDSCFTLACCENREDVVHHFCETDNIISAGGAQELLSRAVAASYRLKHNVTINPPEPASAPFDTSVDDTLIHADNEEFNLTSIKEKLGYFKFELLELAEAVKREFRQVEDRTREELDGQGGIWRAGMVQRINDVHANLSQEYLDQSGVFYSAGQDIPLPVSRGNLLPPLENAPKTQKGKNAFNGMWVYGRRQDGIWHRGRIDYVRGKTARVSFHDGCREPYSMDGTSLSMDAKPQATDLYIGKTVITLCSGNPSAIALEGVITDMRMVRGKQMYLVKFASGRTRKYRMYDLRLRDIPLVPPPRDGTPSYHIPENNTNDIDAVFLDDSEVPM